MKYDDKVLMLHERLDFVNRYLDNLLQILEQRKKYKEELAIAAPIIVVMYGAAIIIFYMLFTR